MKITCTIQSTYDSGERIDIVLVDAELGYKESRMVYEETLFNFIPMFNFENRIKKVKLQMKARYDAIKSGMQFDVEQKKAVELVPTEDIKND